MQASEAVQHRCYIGYETNMFHDYLWFSSIGNCLIGQPGCADQRGYPTLLIIQVNNK